jgi:hypothetical protein
VLGEELLSAQSVRLAAFDIELHEARNEGLVYETIYRNAFRTDIKRPADPLSAALEWIATQHSPSASTERT